MTPGQLLWRGSDATRGCGERRGRPVVSLVPRAMSDSNYAKICQWRKVHEVVDDAWLEDALSDDDVEIPSGDVFAEEGASAASLPPPPLRAPAPGRSSDDVIHIFATLDFLRDDHLVYTPRSLRTSPRASFRVVARGRSRAPSPPTPAGEIDSGDVLEAASKDERWTDLELEQVTGDAPLR